MDLLTHEHVKTSREKRFQLEQQKIDASDLLARWFSNETERAVMNEVETDKTLGLKKWLAVLIVVSPFIAIGYLMIAKSIGAVRTDREADIAAAFTINDAEKSRCDSILNEARHSECIAEIRVSSDKEVSELHVLPQFRYLDKDTKSRFFRAAYHSAFGLPLDTKRFTRLMYVIDEKGQQIQTLDLWLRGTECK